MFGQKASVQLQTAAGCRYSRPLCAAADRPVRLSPGLIRDVHTSSTEPAERSLFLLLHHYTVTERAESTQSLNKVAVFTQSLCVSTTASSLSTKHS